MSYSLRISQDAEKEWGDLDKPIREQFKKKLEERLDAPRVEKDRLSGMKDCYKIKLRSAGFRLVYRVYDEELEILVIAVGKRERNRVYKTAAKRL
ncbi:MAG: type II toxin-antitoxin system RelE/ParE family toxin [Gammaproteobacteria bacterium]|nr:type II toxin-antitoxin system RelE/ParE family toxin [Gammaproteobacteria bacterium]